MALFVYSRWVQHYRYPLWSSTDVIRAIHRQKELEKNPEYVRYVQSGKRVPKTGIYTKVKLGKMYLGEALKGIVSKKDEALEEGIESKKDVSKKDVHAVRVGKRYWYLYAAHFDPQKLEQEKIDYKEGK